MTSRLRVFERSKKAYYIITEAPLRVTIYTAMVVPKSFHEHAGELHVNILSKKEFTDPIYENDLPYTEPRERKLQRQKKTTSSLNRRFYPSLLAGSDSHQQPVLILDIAVCVEGCGTRD